MLPRALAVRLKAEIVNTLAAGQTITIFASFLKTGIQFATDFHVVQGGAVAEAHGVYGVLPLVVPDRVLVIKCRDTWWKWEETHSTKQKPAGRNDKRFSPIMTFFTRPI